jgi:hypothetical protein
MPGEKGGQKARKDKKVTTQLLDHHKNINIYNTSSKEYISEISI